ncbi:MAG: PepSY-like domain-containing protein [Tannerellaceae bacterium]|jgi:hypothetical protein|nr:PepSY-like domain-containing protein [Tannerellaceae bacterium]
MKTRTGTNTKDRVSLFRIYLFGIVFLSGCTYSTGEKEIKYIIPDPVVPNEHVLGSFVAMYPDAREMTWSVRDRYFVVDFINKTEPTNAWFDTPGDWMLSKADIPFERLSGEISDAFHSSVYADWDIATVHRLERNTFETVYLIYLEDGLRSVHLYFSDLGYRIRAIADDIEHEDSPLILPEKAMEVIDDLFDEASLVDLWHDFFGMKICVKDEDIYKNVAFGTYHEWICTIWNITEEDVPENVMHSFLASDYGIYPVEHYQITENRTEVSYVFHFKKEDKNCILTIKSSGLLKSLVSY